MSLHSGIRQKVVPIGGRCGKKVTPLVFRMSVMALYPDKSHLMRLFGGQKALPEIDVLDRFILSPLPSFFYPAVYPALVKSIHQSQNTD